MPKTEIITAVDGQNVKLTNLEKVIYPSLGVTKAEIVQYFIQVAPYLLPYVSNRPLTLIRYPDGIEKDSFYSKNKVKWTPQWIHSIDIPDSDGDIKEYITADNKATLAWIGNLAGLELHPMQVLRQDITKADHFIFDLDPPEDQNNFEAVKDIAFRLKTFLESYDYSPFVKTSGGKGLHLYIPIHAQYEQEEMYEAVKGLAQLFVNQNDDSTLHMNKKKRQGKTLIDIFRNNYAHTCVAPYSLRGKAGAPVSMPITWEQVNAISSPQAFTIRNAISHLDGVGDVWSTFRQFSRPLHTQRAAYVAVSPLLETYLEKRDFAQTPEPLPSAGTSSTGNRFCVQLHNASNLHYDLRLEDQGVLLSWAIPKGLPSESGIKRLAIETEAHPLKYLDFEGVIPKGAYGAGEMWVFDQGNYHIKKKEEKKIAFRLAGTYIQGDYVIYKTKGQQWIIEKKDEERVNFEALTAPMLAKTADSIPDNSRHFFEIKWDGIRCITIINNGSVRLYSRNGNDISKQFPEIIDAMGAIEAEVAVLDGEIVHLEEDGRPNFAKIVGRIHLKSAPSIQKAARHTTATMYYFDLLHLDGVDTRTSAQVRRKAYLKTILTPHERIRYSDDFSDGDALFSAAKTHNLEGIMVKKKEAPYLSATRSDNWTKVKVRIETTATIIGYTEGQGDRKGLIGALHLVETVDGVERYVGKVGTGFDTALLKEVTQKVKSLEEVPKPIQENIEEAHRTKWIEPLYEVEIRYASLSSNNTYREPVFIRMYLKSENPDNV